MLAHGVVVELGRDASLLQLEIVEKLLYRICGFA